ncbi:uncharacterized protein PRCAT00005178001 [Priceomyces carsonii]|uniref:uncharacterized protein n=1 Tax=Priceomyces carsonii TaxID=28549 RepID=UPI002EDA3FC4|nr:unnamed protein product [Priceomyces carsonii]
MELDIEEYKALTSTLLAFYNFNKYEYEQIIKPRKIKLASLSEEELALLPWYPKYIEDLQICIDYNDQFTKTLALTISQDWGVHPNPAEWAPCSATEFDKVRSTLLQLSREWSSDGEIERNISYNKIIEELNTLFPELLTRPDVKVLVPGCGLGRLVLEFVKEGYSCQGNEFSYHMLLTSNFILNHCKYAHSYSIFPYLHKSSHLLKRANQIRPVTIPDVNPTSIHELSEKNPQIPYDDLMSIASGSFTDLYGPPDLNISDTYSKDPIASEFRLQHINSFDVIVTCFFIDTASNIIDYLKTIKHCLKSNGYWINFGPLLWHFEDDFNVSYSHKKLTKDSPPIKVPTTMKGLELSREDLIDLINKMGFRFEKHESNIESTYSGDIRSLGGYIYKCEFWVCRSVDIEQ